MVNLELAVCAAVWSSMVNLELAVCAAVCSYTFNRHTDTIVKHAII
jgi:hypothetical protein